MDENNESYPDGSYYDFCDCFYRLHVFQNASHEHHIESKDEYNKLLRDFLANAE